MPEYCHKDERIYLMASLGLSMVVGFSFAVLSYSLIVDMTVEKAAGLNEILLITGVSRLAVKLAWALYALVFILPLSALLALLIKFTVPNLIEHTPITLIWAYCALFAIATLAYTFFLASLLTSPNQAMGVYLGSLILGQNLPGWSELIPEVGYSGIQLWLCRLFSCLHPSCNALIGIHYITTWEAKGLGASWDALSASPDVEDEFGALAESMALLGVQIFVYTLASFYADLVVPSKHGIRYPPLFFLQPSFWSPDNQTEPEAESSEKGARPKSGIEQLVSQQPPGIVLKKLTKVLLWLVSL